MQNAFTPYEHALLKKSRITWERYWSHAKKSIIHYTRDIFYLYLTFKNYARNCEPFRKRAKTFVHREIILMQCKYFLARRELFCAGQIFFRAMQSFYYISLFSLSFSLSISFSFFRFFDRDRKFSGHAGISCVGRKFQFFN